MKQVASHQNLCIVWNKPRCYNTLTRSLDACWKTHCKNVTFTITYFHRTYNLFKYAINNTFYGHFLIQCEILLQVDLFVFLGKSAITLNQQWNFWLHFSQNCFFTRRRSSLFELFSCQLGTILGADIIFFHFEAHSLLYLLIKSQIFPPYLRYDFTAHVTFAKISRTFS